jgi:hypothetical protein
LTVTHLLLFLLLTKARELCYTPFRSKDTPFVGIHSA